MSAQESALRCPSCKQQLHEPSSGDGLRCRACQRSYPLRDGILQFIDREDLGPQNRKHARLNDLFSYVYGPSVRLMFLPCGGQRAARAELTERLELRPGSAVLEIGVGTGDNFPAVAAACADCHLTGIDIAPHMLRRCSRNLRKWSLEADLHLAQAEHLPFADDSFDVVYHLGAINFFDDQALALREMARVARPGTRVVVADENERALRLLDKLGLQLFIGRRATARPPLEAVPESMEEVLSHTIWRGYGYLIEFRVPSAARAAVAGE